MADDGLPRPFLIQTNIGKQGEELVHRELALCDHEMVRTMVHPGP